MDALVQEVFINFKATRSNSGNLRFSGARDDLTMSLALALVVDAKKSRLDRAPR